MPISAELGSSKVSTQIHPIRLVPFQDASWKLPVPFWEPSHDPTSNLPWPFNISYWKRLLTRTVPVNNFLLTGTVPVNNSLMTETLSYVHRCWLAMSMGAGFMQKTKVKFLLAFFTFIPSQAAIAHWLNWWVYRQLVPLREQGSLQSLDKTLALLGPH